MLRNKKFWITILCVAVISFIVPQDAQLGFILACPFIGYIASQIL